MVLQVHRYRLHIIVISSVRKVQIFWPTCIFMSGILNVYFHFGILNPVTNVIGKYRLRSKDGTAEEVGTNNKRFFILLKKLPFGYTGTCFFLKKK